MARLTERIAAVRGAQIESYGTGDLLVRDGAGEREQSRREARIEMLRETLAARDITTSEKLDVHADVVARTSVRNLMRAALACRDEADFLRRIEHTSA